MDNFVKPSIDQTAWVLQHLMNHLREGGSFRYLIYNRMGYEHDAYLPLYEAGGLILSNVFHDMRESKKIVEQLHVETLPISAK